MSSRARLTLGGAVLLGPLVAFPTLLRPQLAIMLCLGIVAVLLASRSVALPLALFGLPGIAIALMHSNPFPNNSVEIFLAAWLGAGILFTLISEENALPLRMIMSPPVLMTLGLAIVMVWRLGASGDPGYGSHKVQLFLGESVSYLIAGILIARSRRSTTLWSGITLVTVSVGALVLLDNLVMGGAQEVLPGRLGLYNQADPIALARGTATGLLLAIFLLLASPVAWQRTAALALVPVLGISFIGAGSRGPVVGLVAGLFVMIALSVGNRVTRRRLALLGVALLLSAAIVPQLVPGQNISRSLSVLTGGSDAGGGDVSNGRYQIYSEAWGRFASHPFTGIGTGSFSKVNPVAIYPHNVFLEAAAELGFPGLLLLGGLVVLGFVYAGRAWRSSTGEDRQQAALVAGFLTAAVVNAQFSGDLSLNPGVWLGTGLALGMVQRVAPASSGQEPLRRLRTRWRKKGSGAPELLDPVGGSAPRQLPPTLPPRQAQARPAAAGGEITSPTQGSFVRGEVAIACRPGGAGWTIGAVVVERTDAEGRWVPIGEAAAEQDFEVFVLMPGGGRRHVAVLRSERRAEEMRLALAGEHGVTPEQIEIRPAKRGRWAGRDTRELVWDTAGVADGECLLRTVTTDVTGRQALGPETRVVVDNEAPTVNLDGPRQGAVLMGAVDIGAHAKDERSGVALVRFEYESAGAWTEIATVSAAPFRVSWNTGVLGEGDYRLRAIALDRAGNEAVSKLIPVRVERLVAAVKLEDPGDCLARTVRLQASVRDETKIAGVEFQIAVADSFSWQALGAVSEPPFELDFDTLRVGDGVYDLRAVARDRRGGIDASRILRGRRVDNQAPTVTLLEPAAGALLRGEVPLSARASDTGSGVRSAVFQFTADNATWRPVVTRGEAAGAVYWDTTRVADGDYQVRAVVGDAAGNITTSEPTVVRIDNTPPVVRIDEPAAGAYLGGAVNLAASARDPGSGVIGVRFEWSHDGIAWGEIATVPTEPYGTVWDTAKVADGVYRLRVVARDRAGNGVFSEPVELTIRNSLVFEPLPEPEPMLTPSTPEPEPEPEPVVPALERASLWQLERLLEQQGPSFPRREELEAILYTLRPYARPDGTIPEKFMPLLWEAFGELL